MVNNKVIVGLHCGVRNGNSGAIVGLGTEMVLYEGKKSVKSGRR